MVANIKDRHVGCWRISICSLFSHSFVRIIRPYHSSVFVHISGMFPRRSWTVNGRVVQMCHRVMHMLSVELSSYTSFVSDLHNDAFPSPG